jgi:hypothetical protein
MKNYEVIYRFRAGSKNLLVEAMPLGVRFTVGGEDITLSYPQFYELRYLPLYADKDDKEEDNAAS